MLNQKGRERAYLISFLDACLLWIAFIASLWIRVLAPGILWGTPSPINLGDHFWALLITIPLNGLLSSAAGMYVNVATLSPGRTLGGIAKTYIYLISILGLAIFLFQAKSFSRAVFFLFMGLSFVLIASFRLLARRLLRRPSERQADVRNVLIVGVNPDAMEVRRKLERSPEYGFRVVGFLMGPGEPDSPEARGTPVPVLGTLANLRKIVVEEIIDEVVFALPFQKLLDCEPQIAWCEEIGTTVHLKVDFVRTLLSRTYPSDLEGTPMLTISSTPRDPISLAVKRAIDVVVSAAALILLGPLLFALWVLITTTSVGPAIFRQRRIGLNGRTFTLYKFRSMDESAEETKSELAGLNEMSGPVFKMKNDPRVTPVGRWLRKFSLDELPQLWNVLVGDLSLVGPRPPTRDEVQLYERWQRRRLSVKPGVTCLWQVSGRSEIDFEEWMKLDLKYIDSWSLKLDVKILLRTIPAVLFARGSH